MTEFPQSEELARYVTDFLRDINSDECEVEARFGKYDGITIFLFIQSFIIVIDDGDDDSDDVCILTNT